MRTSRILRSRRRRQSNRARNNPFRPILTLFAIVFFLGFVTFWLLASAGVVSAFGAFNYFTSDLPDFTELEKVGQDVDTTFETTKIYAWGEDKNGDGDRDLVLIYEIIDPFGGDRQWISLNRIPQDIVNATVSIEDKTYWENEGYDLEGIGRAFYQYVVAEGQVQGGSSITQQVVKNNLIEEERRIVGEEVGLDDYRRKIDEILLADRISGVYTKEQIIEWYLNTNFYGNFAYGIEAAARVYFDKPAVELTLAEASMLAAIPQSPAYNPIQNPERAKVRQELVLQAMFRDGYITRETLLETLEEEVVVKSSIEERFDIISPHFAFYVREELESRFGREQVLRGGLKVYTTLDLTWQANAECVARAQVAQLSNIPIEQALPADELANCEAIDYLIPRPSWAKGGDQNVNNAAVVMMDPRTAEIKAMVGSLSYWDDSIDGRFNVAVDGLRQPGSSFKPFTFLTGLLEGYTAATMFQDVETDFGTSYNGIAYVPVNYDRNYNGPMRMRTALANSYNVPAVEMMAVVGVDKVIRTAHKMGITTLEDPNDYGLPLTLGGGEVKLIDMVYAFSVFANGGKLIGTPVPENDQKLGFRTLDPVSILRVEDRNGKPIYEYAQPQYEQVITEQQAFIMADMMSDRQARCPAFSCPNSLELPAGRQGAAKTGTTNSYKDAWTVGYTPQLVTGVWVGNTNNEDMDEVPGSLGAAPLWNALMAWALKDEPNVSWTPPDGISQLAVCDLNGFLPSRDCETVTEFFIQGTEPQLIDNMHQRVRINRATGRLATATTPPELVFEQNFILYPDRSLDWARETDKPLAPTQYDAPNAYLPDIGNAVILSPEPFGYVSGVVSIIGNAKADDFQRFSLSVFPAGDPSQAQALTPWASDQRTDAVLGGWNTLSVGDGPYTLLLEVYGNDGQIKEKYQTNVTVDNGRPEVNITFPYEGQNFFVDDEFVVIQAQVIDDFAIDRALFYAGGSGVPFAIGTVPPFTEKYNISGPGCQSFRVQVVDAAGNWAESQPRNVCFINRDTGNSSDG